MAVFKKTIEERSAKPLLVVTLPVSAFSDTSLKKPVDPVEIGLRLISEAEAATARSQAAKHALRYHPSDADEDSRIEAYNGALMVGAIARATCQPDNISEQFWSAPEDQIPIELTSAGVELLFGHLEQLTLAESPSMPEATDEEVAAFAQGLLDGSAWKGMTGSNAHRMKRLLAACMNLMVEIESK